MFLTDKEIIERVNSSNLITPFIDKKVSVNSEGVKIPSYGLSHAGYDVQLQPVYRVSRENDELADIKIDLEGLDEIRNYLKNDLKQAIYSLNKLIVRDVLTDDSSTWYKEVKGESVVIPAKGFMLGVTKEYIKMPNDLSALLIAKSTLIRMGLFFSPTNIEPGWEGEVVVEIFNANPFPVRIYADMGIGQIQFAKLSSDVTVPYNGKYQGQTGIQHGYLG